VVLRSGGEGPPSQSSRVRLDLVEVSGRWAKAVRSARSCTYRQVQYERRRRRTKSKTEADGRESSGIEVNRPQDGIALTQLSDHGLPGVSWKKVGTRPRWHVHVLSASAYMKSTHRGNRVRRIHPHRSCLKDIAVVEQSAPDVRPPASS